jgi:tryptophan-rich hypothetical protein
MSDATTKPRGPTPKPRAPPARTTTRLSPKKLLHGKWTAVTPRRKEKHFLVTRVIEPEVEGGAVEFVELEAVHSKRVQRLPWRELADPSVWVQGWK